MKTPTKLNQCGNAFVHVLIGLVVLVAIGITGWRIYCLLYTSLAGLNNEEAARFSFLLATPIIGAAALLKLPSLFTSSIAPEPVSYTHLLHIKNYLSMGGQ